MKILVEKQIVVTRAEANFDRACETAYRLAHFEFGFDDYGHCSIQGYERSSCCLMVEFVKYEHGGSMTGQSYEYIFKARIEKQEEE